MKSLLQWAVLTLVFGVAHAEPGKVYKWTDEQGVTHFSATPPAQAQDDLTERTFADTSSDVEPPTHMDDAPAPGSERETRCLNAMHLVESLQRRPVAAVRRPGISEPVLVTGAELQDALRRAQRAVEYECGTARDRED